MMIPNTIHLIWLGGPLPNHLRPYVDSLEHHHPHWAIKWWHETEIDALGLRNQDAYNHAPNIVADDSVHQLRSDIARYEILHRYGGVYVDCDYQWQRPMDDLIQGERLVCCWELQHRHVANGWIAAEPGHPALDATIRDIPDRIANRHPSNRANRLTGPHAWGPNARHHGARIVHQARLHPVPWNRPEWARERTYPDAHAIHHWNHQSELRGLW